MRFISIEENNSTEKVLVNVAGGTSVSTKFTSVEHAVDYIQRAPSVSMGGG